MKIAILGWGSLIWNPGDLEINKDNGKNGWFNEGPMLPIEFARISQDGRLTLVIVAGKKEVQTLYAISKFEELDHAVLDLAIREGCSKAKIGFFKKSDRSFHSNSNFIEANIASWIDEQKEFEAVIWTDLSKNFKVKIGVDLTDENAFNYIKCLPLEVKVKAELYIRRTPTVIDTPIRQIVEEKLGWTPIVI